MPYGSGPYGLGPYLASGLSVQSADVTEAIACVAPLTAEQLLPVPEVLVFSETLTLEQVFAVVESIALADTEEAMATRVATLLESLRLDDRQRLVFEAVLTDQVALADTITADPTRMAAIVDTLLLTEAASGSLQALAIVADALTLADLVQSIQAGEIIESLGLADALTARLSAYEAIITELVLADTGAAAGVFTVLVDERLVFDDTQSALATLTAVIREGLGFALSFTFDGTPYVGIAMNARTRAVTTYDNFEANSLTTFNGVLYGAFEDGLYRMDGDTDGGDEIAWRIRTGLSRLGAGVAKRLDAAYIGIAATGEVVLKCIYVPRGDGGGEKLEQWYTLQLPEGGAMRTLRQKTGKGMRAVYWAFELAGTGTLELDNIELRPLLLERRV